jgi:hypothetical protein
MKGYELFLIGLTTGGVLVGTAILKFSSKPVPESGQVIRVDTVRIQLPPDTIIQKVTVEKVKIDTTYVLRTKVKTDTVWIEKGLTTVAELDTTIKDLAHLNIRYYLEPSLFDLQISDRVILKEILEPYRAKWTYGAGVFIGTDFAVGIYANYRRFGGQVIAGRGIGLVGINYRLGER